MTKKLRIRFVKFEKALVMQILEQTGEFMGTKHVKLGNIPELGEYEIYLRGWRKDYDLIPVFIRFSSNDERDEYLEKVVGWITYEQFTNAGEPKVGDWCEVRDDEKQVWVKRKLVAILPEQYSNRHICETLGEKKKVVKTWTYARPLAQRIEHKIDGDVYTWDMEVAE